MTSSDSEYSDSPLFSSAFAQFRTPSPTHRSGHSGRFRLHHRSVTDSDGGLDEADDRNDVPPRSNLEDSDGSDSDSDLPSRSEHRSAATDFGMQVRATPRTIDGTRRDPTSQTAQIHRKSLTKALGVITQTDAAYVKRRLVQQSKQFPIPAIMTWLRTKAASLNLFDPKTKRWIIPEHPADETELYQFFVSIFNAILGAFVTPDGTLVEREVVDIHNVMLSHIDGQHKSSPDLGVRATGSSFEDPFVGTVGWANMATFIDVKLDNKISRAVHLEQLAGYAHQIFAFQPNRKFVKCLLLSEKRVRLVQFDRAGAESSQLINFEDSPELLVRIIISLCTIDERELGLDTSIQWTIVNGKKISGTIKTYGPGQEETTYELVDVHPISQDYDIRGRGTTIWKVLDPAKEEEFLVKQSWTSDGRPHEHLHLTRAKGIPGICEMVGYEVLEEIKQFRCANTVFANRVGLRIILRIYGEQVDRFTSVLQALRAIRDAVAAHEMLWRKKILHRDITNKNILLGKEGAAKGWYGVLIDLGVALDFQDETNTNVTKEARSGSRFFQTCVILEHITRVCVGEAPAHDYLDDLECFFYVLCFLFFIFHPDGRKRESNDIARDIVRDWDHESAERALSPKAMIFNPTRSQKRFAARIVTESWGSACGALFKGFAEWIWGIHREKADLLDDYRDKLEQNQGEQQSQKQSRVSQDPTVRGAFAPLLLDSERHYAEVLSLLDIAIAAVETSPANGAPPREALEKRILSDPTEDAGPSKNSRRG